MSCGLHQKRVRDDVSIKGYGPCFFIIDNTNYIYIIRCQ